MTMSMSSAMAESTAAPENVTVQEPPLSATAASHQPSSPSSSAAAACDQPPTPSNSKPPPEAAAAAAPAAENATTTTTATSATAATATGTAAGPSPSSSSPANIEFEPPAACIRRLLKQALPKSTNVSRDSLAAISRASGIFVLYLTACANDVAREGRRSTIVAKDVLGALKELDFGDFVPLLERFLEVHRREEKSKKEGKERAKRAVQERIGGDGVRDGTTGKFVAKDRQRGEEGTEEGTAAVVEPATAVETKHAREEEEGNDNQEGGALDQPSPKKLKVDEEQME